MRGRGWLRMRVLARREQGKASGGREKKGVEGVCVSFGLRCV